LEGNETVIIQNYKGVESNVKYSTGRSEFICNYISGDLVCKTPKVEEFTPFQSYSLLFSNNSNPLGLEFILYKKNEIQKIYPSVIPSSIGSKFNFNVTLKEGVKMSQGSIVIVVGVGNDALISRYEQSPYPNQTIVSDNINSLQSGKFSVGIFYKHPKSIEIQYFKIIHILEINS
jgi:hypothetical protein